MRIKNKWLLLITTLFLAFVCFASIYAFPFEGTKRTKAATTDVYTVGATAETASSIENVENWGFDKNGISDKKIYKNGEQILQYGIYEDGAYANANGTGSTFNLTGGNYISFGGKLDVTRKIHIGMQISNAFGDGRFYIAGFANYDDLFSAGQNAWEDDDAISKKRLGVWSAIDYTVENVDDFSWLHHKFATHTDNQNPHYAISDECDYETGYAELEIYIGTGAENDTSYIALNGKKFADLSITRADFPEKTMVLSFTAFEVSRHIPRLKVWQSNYFNADGISMDSSINEYGVNNAGALYKITNGALVAQTITGFNAPWVGGSTTDGSEVLYQSSTFNTLGKEYTVDTSMELRVQLNESNGTNRTCGRYIICAYESLADLMAAGTSGWDVRNSTSKFALFFSNDANKNAAAKNAYYNKLVVSSDNTATDEYCDIIATDVNTVSIVIREDNTQISCGADVFSLPITRSSFSTGKLVFSIMAMVDDGADNDTAANPSECLVYGRVRLNSYIYSNAEGGDLTWNYDANGIVSDNAQIYKLYDNENKSLYTEYGLDNAYYEVKDGYTSFAVDGGKFVSLGGAIDVTKPIKIRMRAYENNGEGRSRFSIVGFKSYDEMLDAGPFSHIYSESGTELGLRCSINTSIYGITTKYYHKVNVGDPDAGQFSKSFDYENYMATILIFIGETEAESYVTLNGEKFANLNVKRSDYIDNKIYFSVAVSEMNDMGLDFQICNTEEALRPMTVNGEVIANCAENSYFTFPSEYAIYVDGNNNVFMKGDIINVAYPLVAVGKKLEAYCAGASIRFNEGTQGLRITYEMNSAQYAEIVQYIESLGGTVSTGTLVMQEAYAGNGGLYFGMENAEKMLDIPHEKYVDDGITRSLHAAIVYPDMTGKSAEEILRRYNLVMRSTAYVKITLNNVEKAVYFYNGSTDTAQDYSNRSIAWVSEKLLDRAVDGAYTTEENNLLKKYSENEYTLVNNWSDSETMEQYLKPYWNTSVIQNETILFIGAEGTATLMYEPNTIISIRDYQLQTTYKEGVDYKIIKEEGKPTQIQRIATGNMPYFEATEIFLSSPSTFEIGVNPDAVSAYGLDPNVYKYLRYDELMTLRHCAVTYTHSDEWAGYVPEDQSAKLTHTLDIINGTGERTLNVVVYGDSVATGCNASGTQYGGYISPYMPSGYDVFAQYLEKHYDGLNVNLKNVATGGWVMLNCLQYYEERIGSLGKNAVDLLILRIGGNDLNTSEEDYKSYLNQFLDKFFTDNPNANIIIESPFGTNTYSNWRSALSISIEGWDIDVMNIHAKGGQIAVDRIYTYVSKIEERKKPIDWLANNINHSNDYIIRLSVQMLLKSLFGSAYDGVAS